MSDTWLEKLSDEECLAHLRREILGGIAVIVDGLPVVLPINYRTVGGNHDPWLVVPNTAEQCHRSGIATCRI
jgi:nitroimidazol reductase NimA-like FMN-containing flavoprotein (pyridoxamine 5'-phosphate oxidase superfamily)